MKDNNCIICGCVIPEGRHICLTCEHTNDMQTFNGSKAGKFGVWRNGNPDKGETREFKYCSTCNHEAYWDTDYGQQLFPFCPYCGSQNRRASHG